MDAHAARFRPVDEIESEAKKSGFPFTCVTRLNLRVLLKQVFISAP
jgi:hypothetical protein